MLQLDLLQLGLFREGSEFRYDFGYFVDGIGPNTTVEFASDRPDPGLKASIFDPFSGG